MKKEKERKRETKAGDIQQQDFKFSFFNIMKRNELNCV
jgi:hypothetical protein